MFEQSKKDAKLVDYSSFEKLHSLVRSTSLEVKCDHCTYTARNKARLNKHIEFTHIFICEILKSETVEWNKEE